MRNLLLLLPFFALARLSHAEEDPLHVAYVNMARCINEVEDGKKAKTRLQEDFEKKQQKLDKLQTELKTEKDDFEKRAGMMKPEARQAKQDELQRKLMELQQTYMQLQKELLEKEAEITEDITKKLRAVIARLGDRDTYNMILNIGDTVLYYKRHHDLTDEVVKEYNRQYAK